MSRKPLKSRLSSNTTGVLGPYRRIATKIIQTGNLNKTAGAVGYALKLLGDLSHSCGYNNIQAGASAKKIYNFPDGSFIELEINYGLSTVLIHSPTGEDELKVVKVCPPGYKCFIFAVIDSVSPTIGAEFTEQNYMDFLVDGSRFSYDVSFCYLNSYVSLKGYEVTSAGHEKYNVGQFVLLGPAPHYDFQPNCCMDDRDLAAVIYDENSLKLHNGYLDVYPLSILNGMTKKPLEEKYVDQ